MMPHATAVRTGPEPNRQVGSRVVDYMHVGGFVPRLPGLCYKSAQNRREKRHIAHNSLHPHIRTSMYTPHPLFERQPPDKIACGDQDDIACENVMHRGCKNSTSRHANRFRGCSFSSYLLDYTWTAGGLCERPLAASYCGTCAAGFSTVVPLQERRFRSPRQSDHRQQMQSGS